VLGTNHPTAALFYNRCGHVYRATHDVEHAAAAYEKGLMIHQAVLGPAHPTTAFSHFYMAEALAAKGQFVTAAEHASRAMVVREQVLGERHPLTLNSMYQMAVVCDKLNEAERAIGIFARVLHVLKVCEGLRRVYFCPRTNGWRLCRRARTRRSCRRCRT
jgi:hypothetical protein